MMISRERQFNDIVAMSETMLERAEASDWPGVAAYHAERDRALEQFFSTRPTIEEAAFVAPGIEKILALDAKLLALGTSAYKSVSETLSQIHVGHDAQQAYAQVAGIGVYTS